MIASLDHVLVLTDDLDASLAFYRDALGLEVCVRPPLPFPGYWLGVDGRVALHLADRGAYDEALAALGLERPVGPVDHVSFLGRGADELAGRLEAAGVGVVRNEVPGAFRQLFVTDPNGVRVEVNVPLGDAGEPPTS
jgi:catechol 2,3-dioxygenase-like lactoylglutathione lyase family enzyme